MRRPHPIRTARLAPLALLALLGALAGCGEHDDHGGHGGHGEEPEGDPIAVGFSVTGEGGLTAELAALEPAAPVRGDNAWTVRLKAGDAALEGCAIVVEPYMPAHDHGTGEVAEVEALGEGQYRLEPINLFMRGLWTVDLDLDCAGRTDRVRFEVWIEG